MIPNSQSSNNMNTEFLRKLSNIGINNNNTRTELLEFSKIKRKNRLNRFKEGKELLNYKKGKGSPTFPVLGKTGVISPYSYGTS